MTELERCAGEAASDDRHPAMPILMGAVAFWSIALEDGLREIHGADYFHLRSEHPDGVMLPAIRLARNAVSHGQLICARAQGMVLPITYPMDFGPWVWKPLGELFERWIPKETDYLPAQIESYRQNLSQRVVPATIEPVLNWFRELTAG